MLRVDQLTRYPSPFKVRINVRYNIDYPDQKDILEGKQYETVYEMATNEPDYGHKLYGPSKYMKTLYDEYIKDTWYRPTGDERAARLPPFHYFNLYELQLVEITPINHGRISDTEYNIHLYLAVEHLSSILMPFFNHNWYSFESPRDLEIDKDYQESIMFDEDEARIITSSFPIIYLSDGEINMLFPSGHPGMILSGLSIMQSAIARTFSDLEMRGLGELFGDNYEMYPDPESAYKLWSDYENRQGLDLKVLMAETFDIHYRSGNNIPGLGFRYNSALDVLLDMLREYTRNTGTMKDRCAKLVWDYFKNDNLDSRPKENKSAMFRLNEDEFDWDNGPEVN